ncbi:hypothetical protein HOE67_03190 [Candidatus Peregrinibacteria bacterium]|jgi:hypothetical protein|nr:hypothetical protein [Candidatus Peregrinibacteria bacterium]MBT4056091.1 hypothetical protein [Candidatus Peregrinibacteria bacterium]
MSDNSKLVLIKEALDTAEAGLLKAKQLFKELSGDELDTPFAKKADRISSAPSESTNEENVVEGIFDGEKMIDKGEKTYPVPANYASKSKLIPGDALKLTINDDGSFVYKQIGPVDRKQVIGTLTYEDGDYKVITKTKAYKVLLASVTYYKGEIGDKVTLIIPEKEASDWGSIDNVLPRDATDMDTTGEF